MDRFFTGSQFASTSSSNKCNPWQKNLNSPDVARLRYPNAALMFATAYRIFRILILSFLWRYIL